MKSLFTEKYSLTNEASDFVAKYNSALHSVLKHYNDLGFNQYHVEKIVRCDFVTLMRLVVFGEGKTLDGELGVEKSLFVTDLQPLPNSVVELIDGKTHLCTEAGSNLAFICRKETMPIIDEMLKQGYSPWEVQSVLVNSASDFFETVNFLNLDFVHHTTIGE